MLHKLLLSPLLLQNLGDATELLSTTDVTIIGVLLFLIVILITAVIYLFKRNEKLTDLRLEEQKEFTKQLLSITEKTSATVAQINEILKITQKNV